MDKLISQKKLLEEFRSLCGPATGDGWDNFGVRDLIMRQPVVDAVPVIHGRWVKPEQSLWSMADCSVCGEMCIVANTAKYCPNCGAKMDKVVAENETD